MSRATSIMPTQSSFILLVLFNWILSKLCHVEDANGHCRNGYFGFIAMANGDFCMVVIGVQLQSTTKLAQ